ncbi:hypothetical protein BDV18DRAFT_147357 [Aspergillus unguis]
MYGALEHSLLSRGPNDGVPRGLEAVIISATLLGLSSLVMAMRIYTRVVLIRQTDREDVTILFSLAFSAAYVGCVVAQYHFGLGKHSFDITKEEHKKQIKTFWISLPMYEFSFGLAKISILLRFLRLFPSRRFCIICYIVLGIVVAETIWAICAALFNCQPVARFWDPDITGSCMSRKAVWFFNAAINIATDLTLLILPMSQLSRLNLPRKQKIALIAVFALGGLVVVISILRLRCFYSRASPSDASYDNVCAAYWSAAETNISIICASLPYLRPLISRFFPKFLTTTCTDKYTSAGNPAGCPAHPPTIGHASSRKVADPEAVLNIQDREFGLTAIDVENRPGAEHSSGISTVVAAKDGTASGSGVYRGGEIQATTEVILEASPTQESYSPT